ncbi:MAG: hypothetical protein HC767_12845 [Akkermansiaceae bacterium]|nr:hypothetical protein [Akkermansiaceae bacterium]
MIVRSFTSGPPNPITARRIKRFCEIKRGYYSLILLLVLGFIAMLDQAIVGKRALAVNYEGKWTFPAFMPKELKNKDFGINGETAEAPADYRKLKRLWKETGENRVIMPLVPYDPTGDTLPPRSKNSLSAMASTTKAVAENPIGDWWQNTTTRRKGKCSSATPCAKEN